MAGLSYKPLSYTELSTFQLLCIKDVYQLIDTICADKYADWNIIDFEKAVVSNKYPNSYDEQSVRAAIESSLLKLDAEKPRKRYLEQGKHYAYELFPLFAGANFVLTTSRITCFGIYGKGIFQ